MGYNGFVNKKYNHFYWIVICVRQSLAKIWLIGCVLLVVIPLLVIVASLGEFDAEIWAFLLDYQLPLLLKNTAILALLVAFGVVFLGVSLAWVTTMYRFPAQRLFASTMMLPLAMPAYVLAFTWIGLFEYTGIFGQFFREYFGLDVSIRHVVGLAFVMSLAFYPYVYLLAKNAFATMGGRAMEVGASLGLSPRRSFLKVAMPMARPFVMGGLWLCMMEVLADFGTVSVFGYETFSTAIYEAWFGFFSLETAKQLAFILVSFVLMLVVIEQLNRGRRRFYDAGKTHKHNPKTLVGYKKWLAFFYCALVLSLSFGVPLLQLLYWVLTGLDTVRWGELFWQTWHSLSVSLVAGILVGALSLSLVLCVSALSKQWAVLLKVATLGYAIPGVVLAVGVFVPVAWVDNHLIELFDLERFALLKGTLAVLFVAYVIRFLALGVSAVGAGAERIKKSNLESAYVLGKTPMQAFFLVYLPMIKGSLLVAVLLTFVDVMKEIPITLMMRPTGFDMLSARVYAFSSEGMYDKAAFASLIIVLVGLLPVLVFSKMEQK